MVDIRSMVNVLLITLGSATLLAATHWLTTDRIARNQNARLRAELQALITDPKLMPAPLPQLSMVPASWEVCGELLLVRSRASGYAGPIELLYTLNQKAPTLDRLRILSHQETPGITRFLRDSDGGWLRALTGQTALSMSEVATVSGATITSRAIRNHLAAVLDAPREHLGDALNLVAGTLEADCPE